MNSIGKRLRFFEGAGCGRDRANSQYANRHRWQIFVKHARLGRLQSLHTLQVIILALIQGVTELFPISSVGHNVIVPRLLQWHLNQAGPAFLPFVVVLHLGTALALLIFFWKDWVDVVRGILGRGEDVERNRHLFDILLVGTLPAVFLGFFLQNYLKSLFASLAVASVMLIVNGVGLVIGERLRRTEGKTLADIGWKEALVVGLAESTALIPGISRSGATMVAGMGYGLKTSEAAHYAFLLGFPVILGAGVLEVPKLTGAAVTPGTLPLAIVGGLVAAVVAYLSVAFLTRYFRHREGDALRPFAYYCWALGIVGVLGAMLHF